MSNFIWTYSFLPLFSATYCLVLFKNLLFKKSSQEYLFLFANLALMNTIQAAGYIIWSYSISMAEYFADAYLISAYFFFTHLMLFALGLSIKPIKLKYRNLLYFFPLLLTLFHINGLMIESYRVENNALLHNDGELAWSLDLFILVACFAIISFLWRNIKDGSNERVMVSKNIIALLSFIPIILVFFILVLLSRTAYAVPVVVIVPLITIYTAATNYYLSRDKVADLSIGVGFFYNRLKLAYLLLETHKAKSNLKTFNKAVEKQFIREALQEKNGNIQETANYLNINHTTLRNKIKEYGLLDNDSATSKLPASSK